ncbi:MAG: FAD-dependent oxidoreductase [Candidatus Nanopelagicus sp.]
MRSSTVDVLIVGAGPAGLAAAIELKKNGVNNVRVVEREKIAGGVPRHSYHLGYGVRDLKKFTSGPKYAKYYVEKALRNGVEISTSTTATNWIDQNTLALTSPAGLERVTAKVILLATGARERGRSARAVAGKRAAGIYTTGSLQQATYLEDLFIGKTAVIVGTEHVSLSAVITLKHAGVKSVAMITDQKKHQTIFGAPTLMKLLFGFKLHLDTKIVEIQADQRVSGVMVRSGNKQWVIKADTIVFTGDWIPDHELLRRGNLPIEKKYKSPITDGDGLIPNTQIYSVGNLNLPIKGADKCAVQARKIARKIAKKIG